MYRLLFPTPEWADRHWASIAKATADGTLGCAAKIGSQDQGKRCCVCVYVDDFSDQGHVAHVLQCLVELQVVPQHPVSFKADVITGLGLYSKDTRLRGESVCKYTSRCA